MAEALSGSAAIGARNQCVSVRQDSSVSAIGASWQSWSSTAGGSQMRRRAHAQALKGSNVPHLRRRRVTRRTAAATVTVRAAVAEPAAMSGGELTETDREKNESECREALTRLGRTMEALPTDLADAVRRGRVPGAVVERYFQLENAFLLGFLMRFGGFKERLLGDDLFMTKMSIEVGIGICTMVKDESG